MVGSATAGGCVAVSYFGTITFVAVVDTLVAVVAALVAALSLLVELLLQILFLDDSMNQMCKADDEM